MDKDYKYYLKLFSLPLSLFVLFLTIYLLWELIGLPPNDELLVIIESWFDRYGLPILFLCAVVEAMLLIGGYFPGTFVILVGVVFANSPEEAIVTVLVAVTGLFLGHACNYFLGKYGWYKVLVRFGLQSSIEDAKLRLEKRGPIALWSSYLLSSVASVVDTAAGIIQMDLKKFLFYSFFSTLFWGVLVGTIVYLVGDKTLELLSPGGNEFLIVIGILGLWMGILFFIDRRKSIAGISSH